MPRRVRPTFPQDWHVPNDPKLWITWSHASAKLRNERVYWLSTSTSAGRPHAAPLWGIWKNEAFHFETDPWSAKGRNLAANPLAVVHVQDGLDTVIAEGVVERIKGKAELSRLQKDYQRKYDYRPDWADESRQVVFRLKPRIIHAWRAPRMHRTLVNFVF